MAKQKKTNEVSSTSEVEELSKTPEEETQTGINPLLDVTDRAKLYDYLKKIEAQCDETFEKLKANFDICEAFYEGRQWGSGKENPKGYVTVDASGTPIYTFKSLDMSIPGDKNGQMPKRVDNVTFSLVEGEHSIIGDLDPVLVAAPTIADDDAYKHYAHIVNLFFGEVFERKTRAEYRMSTKDVLIHGHSPIYIKYDQKKSNEHVVPFELCRESVRKVKGDKDANDWSDVRWAIREVELIGYQVKENYGKNIDDKDLYRTVSMKEFYILNDETRGWRKYVVYKNEVIDVTTEEEELPCLPIEVIRIYTPMAGWHGISEVGNVIEQQVMINKQTSLMDYAISYGSAPAVEVDEGVQIPRDGKPILWPTKLFTKPKSSTNPNRPSVNPISYQMVTPEQYANARSMADSSIQQVTGITAGLQGHRQTGIYSAKFAKLLDENASTRIRGKEYWLRYTLENIGYKLIEFARADLGDKGYYEIYDPIAKEIIQIKASDLDPKKFNLTVEVSEANLMSASSRIELINQIKQYAPELDSSELILSVNRIASGLFRQSYIDRLNEEQETKKLQTEINRRGLENQYLQMKEQEANPEQPVQPAEPPIEQPPMNQAVQQPMATPPAQPPVGNQDQVIQDFTMQLIQALSQAGYNQAQAEQIIGQAFASAEQAQPGSIDEMLTLVAETVKSYLTE